MKIVMVIIAMIMIIVRIIGIRGYGINNNK